MTRSNDQLKVVFRQTIEELNLRPGDNRYLNRRSEPELTAREYLVTQIKYPNWLHQVKVSAKALIPNTCIEVKV